MAMRASTSSASLGSGGGAGSSSRNRLSDAKSSPSKPVWRGAAPRGGVTEAQAAAAASRSPAKARTPTRTRTASGNRPLALSTSTSSGLNDVSASPSLDPNVGRGQGMLLSTDADESNLLGEGSFDERGLERLSLLDSPVTKKAPSRSSARLSSAAKPKAGGQISTARTAGPSWGPRSSQGAGTVSSSPSKGKMRLLDGVNDGDDSSAQGKPQRTLGTLSYGNKGQQRARQSIFARPTQAAQSSSPTVARTRTPSKNGETPLSSPVRDGEQYVGERSTETPYRQRTSSASSSHVKERVAAIESTRQQQDVFSGATATLRKRASMGNGSGSRESDEQLDAQLVELKRLNYIFESYESMLQSSTVQVDDFSQRIADTNALLDMYIDLMKQTERTQQLLMDRDWKGATAEEEAIQALEAELAAREAQHRREQAEAEARAAAAAQEQARREEAARAARTRPVETRGPQAVGRGAMTGSSARGGMTRGASSIARGAARGGSISGIGRGRAVSGPAGASARAIGTARTVSSSTASSSATAQRSTAGGLNNRYANVRSSGYGPK